MELLKRRNKDCLRMCKHRDEARCLLTCSSIFSVGKLKRRCENLFVYTNMEEESFLTIGSCDLEFHVQSVSLILNISIRKFLNINST